MRPKEMRKCFNKMQEIVAQKDQSKISSRICFMFQDIIDLRANKWIPKRNEINSEIQRETREFERQDIQVNSALSNVVRKDDCNSNKNRGLDNSTNDGYSQSVGKVRSATHSVATAKLKNKSSSVEDMQLGVLFMGEGGLLI